LAYSKLYRKNNAQRLRGIAHRRYVGNKDVMSGDEYLGLVRSIVKIHGMGVDQNVAEN